MKRNCIIKTLKNIILVIVLISIFSKSYSQVQIVGSNIQPAYVTPASILECTLINNSTETVSVIETVKLMTLENLVLLTSTSNEIIIVPGLNAIQGSNAPVLIFNYSNTEIAQLLQTYQRLPAGIFRICIDIMVNGEPSDSYCDEIENTTVSFISLIYPPHEEAIYTPYPILNWHTSDFPLVNNQMEFYEMVVVEMVENQNPEVAVAENQPVLFINGLREFQVPYPVSAYNLVPGKSYAWQVKKIRNGSVTDQSEAWIFKYLPTDDEANLKYVKLKKKLDATYYAPANNKVYFQFTEPYPGNELNCSIINDKMEPIKPRIIDDKNSGLVDVKSIGDNRYEIDLAELDIRSGYHTLIVKNNKNEKYYLKILVP